MNDLGDILSGRVTSLVSTQIEKGNAKPLPNSAAEQFRDAVGRELYSAYTDLEKAIEMFNRDGRIHPITFEQATIAITRAAAAAGALWTLTGKGDDHD